MRCDRNGFTLLELMVSIGILGIVMTAVFQLSLTARAVSEESAALSILEAETLKVIERLSSELRHFSDDPASGFAMDLYNFSGAPVIGYDFETDTPLYGDLVSWTLIFDDGEDDDGIDNDGDRLIDEMQLLRTDNQGVEVICNHVAKNGLMFTKTGKKVVLSLTLTSHVQRNNQVIFRTISPVTVTLRN